MSDVRYTNQFYSLNDTLWKIDIWDRDYTGAATEFNTDVPGFTLNYPSEGSERFNPVIGAECVIHLVNETDEIDTLLSDILEAEEKRFAILIYKNSSLFWCGWVTNDLIEDVNENKPRGNTITASDFAILKYIDYDNSGTNYTDTIRVHDHIIRALNKSGLYQFWNSNDEYLKTSVDWIETNHPARDETKDPLYYTRLYSNVFNKEVEGLNELKPSNCYDVLMNIAKSFGCRLFQSNGMFNFIQINNYADNNAYVRAYDYSGTLKSTDTEDFRITINQTTNALKSYIQNRYYPPLQKVTLQYDFAKYLNILPPASNYESEVSLGIMNLDDRIKFAGIIKTIFTPLIGSPDSKFKCVFHLKIKLEGDSATVYYLKGDNYQQTPAEWTTNSSDVFIIRSLPTAGLFYSVAGMRDVKYTQIGFDANKFPERGILTFELDLISYIDIYNAPYTPNGGISYTCDNFKLTYVNEDDSINLRKYITAINQDSGGNILNSYIYDHGVIIIGDGRLSKEGSLETNDGSSANWILSTSWEHATDGSTYTLAELLAVEILAGQRVSRAVMQGSIIGNFSVLNSLVYDSLKWVFLGGSYSASVDEWQAEWFEIAENRPYIFAESEDDNISSDTGDGLGSTLNELNGLFFNLNFDEDGNIIVNLPTDSSGLLEGTLWNNNGTVEIKLP